MTCSLRPSAARSEHVAATILCALLLGALSARVARAEDLGVVPLSSSALSDPRPRSSAAFSLSSPRAAPSSSYALEEPTLASARYAEDDREPRFKDPMSDVGIGVKLGLAGTRAGEGSFEVADNRLETRTDKRLGFHLSVPIYLGGQGFGWVFEPMLQKSAVSHSLKDNVGRVVGAESVGVLGLGLYTGPQVQVHATEAFYVGVGLGAKVLYLANDAFEYGVDLYGRVPVSATYYVHQHLAFMCELGLGYGMSVFADAPRAMIDTSTGVVRNVSDDPEIGSAFAWDLTFGVRVP